MEGIFSLQLSTIAKDMKERSKQNRKENLKENIEVGRKDKIRDKQKTWNEKERK